MSENMCRMLKYLIRNWSYSVEPFTFTFLNTEISQYNTQKYHCPGNFKMSPDKTLWNCSFTKETENYNSFERIKSIIYCQKMILNWYKLNKASVNYNTNYKNSTFTVHYSVLQQQTLIPSY